MTENPSDSLVTVFENADGLRAYQPTLPNGERLYDDYSAAWMMGGPDRVWRYPPGPEAGGKAQPVLYMSERRAHRKALREQKRRDMQKIWTFREVTR